MQSTHLTARAAILGAILAGAAPAQSLEAVLAEAERLGVRTGVAVADVDDGRFSARHRADEPFLPASNQKLLTAAAFLDALGTDYRFRTGFRLRDGVLVVAGHGDPNWITGSDLDPAALFGAVAADLRAAGVDAIRGLRLDAGDFDGPDRPASWPAREHWRTYAAPTGAHVVDRSCWSIRVQDGGDHDALVTLLAPPGLTLTGRIELTDDRRKGGRYSALQRGTELRLSGHFLRGARPRVESGAVQDAALAYEGAAGRLLEAAGISFDPAAPERDLDLPDVETPLAPCLVRTLRDSSNFDAEQLLRVLGAELREDGSFSGGAAALARQLERTCGGMPDSTVVADGSGLSYDNRVSPETLVRVLIAAARAPWSQEFVAALPRPGEEGTLERRFRDSPVAPAVRAKTGTLNVASSLSGYVRRSDGHLLAFAIVMNWKQRADGADPRSLQERIVEAIANEP